MLEEGEGGPRLKHDVDEDEIDGSLPSAVLATRNAISSSSQHRYAVRNRSDWREDTFPADWRLLKVRES